MRLFFLSAILFLLSACRGQKSTEPPILPIRNMVEQTSYGPQAKNDFYPDGRAMRAPVQGTVAEDQARTDPRLYLGIEPGSNLSKPVWVTKIPLALTEKNLQRGQAQFNVYCSPCHGITGNSDGLVTQRSGGTIRPANLHDQVRQTMPVGEIYNAISNGVNNWNMPGFAAQMPVEDRWAVVAYVRALQLSQHATLNDVPAEIKIEHEWSHKK